jgi:hypothetical protein
MLPLLHAGQFVVTNQKQADKAGELIGEMAALRAAWTAEWNEDIQRARKLWMSLRERWIKGDEILDGFVGGMNKAVTAWQKAEADKRLEAARQLNAAEQADNPGSLFVAAPAKVQVSGLESYTHHKAEVYWCAGDGTEGEPPCVCKHMSGDDEKGVLHYTQGLRLLVQAVAKGKADIAYIEEDGPALNKLAVDKHDKAVAGYLLPGVRVVTIQSMRRKPQ